MYNLGRYVDAGKSVCKQDISHISKTFELWET